MKLTRREMCIKLSALACPVVFADNIVTQQNDYDVLKRQKQLSGFVDSNKVTMRLLEEITSYQGNNINLQKKMLGNYEKYVVNNNNTGAMLLGSSQSVAMFAVAGKKIVPPVISMMKKMKSVIRKNTASKNRHFHKALEVYFILLATLGQIGPDAHDALSTIEDDENNTSILGWREGQPTLQWSYKMVKANIKDELTQKQLIKIFPYPDQILNNKNKSTYRFPLDSVYSLKMLLLIRPQRWFSKSNMKSLAKYYLDELNKMQSAQIKLMTDYRKRFPNESLPRLDDIVPQFRSMDDIILIPVILGSLGKRASSAFEILEKCERVIKKEKSNRSLFVSLAMARIKPKKHPIIMNRLLERFSQIKTSHLEGLASDLQSNEYLPLLMDINISRYLGKKVLHDNVAIKKIAISILGDGGLSAKHAVPDILKFLQGTDDEQLRLTASTALSKIASYSQIKHLEEALKHVKSKLVLDSLARSIQSVRMAGTNSI